MFDFVCVKHELLGGVVGYAAKLESDDVVYRVVFMPEQFITLSVVCVDDSVVATHTEYQRIHSVNPY